MPSLRRVRGWLVRAVLHRTTALILGFLLCAPAVWLWWREYQWERWYTDGLGLVVGATGLALIVAAIAVVGLAMKLLPWFYQTNGAVIALTLPAHLAVAWAVRALTNATEFSPNRHTTAARAAVSRSAA